MNNKPEKYYLKKLLIDFLSEFITEDRKKLFRRVLLERTKYITVVLEDVYQAQNASAVLRSCDGFGIQDVYIIENRNKFNLHPDIELGSANWLSIKKFSNFENNTLEAINQMKALGYIIIGTSAGGNSVELSTFDIAKGKSAIFFGTERIGLSSDVFQHVDECIRIPMLGFTGSFNLSVSVAIVLYELTRKLREHNVPFRLSEEELIDNELAWLRNSIKNSYMLEKEFFKRNKCNFN